MHVKFMESCVPFAMTGSFRYDEWVTNAVAENLWSRGPLLLPRSQGDLLIGAKPGGATETVAVSVAARAVPTLLALAHAIAACSSVPGRFFSSRHARSYSGKASRRSTGPPQPFSNASPKLSQAFSLPASQPVLKSRRASFLSLRTPSPVA